MPKSCKTPKSVSDPLLPESRTSEQSEVIDVEFIEPRNAIEARKRSDLVEIASRLGEFKENYGIIVGGFLYLRTIEVAGKSPTILRAGWIVALASLALTFWKMRS